MDMNSQLILIVDDIELNRAILNEIFSKNYTVLEASNGEEALSIIQEHHERISAVLLDVVMPVMNGFELLEHLRSCEWFAQLPVIMISAESSEDFVVKGYNLGVADFIGRPFSPNIIRRRVQNIVDLYSQRASLENMVSLQTAKLNQANLFMVDTLSTVVEFRSGESSLHIRNIRKITELLLEAAAAYYPEFGITRKEIDLISNAAALHDIGKIVIPEALLNKPGRLTPEEFEIIKSHTVRGADILEHVEHVHDMSYFKYCYDICRSHHERWDGRGYPDHLIENEIPISAQVVSIADVYDALTSNRVYKPAYSHEEALAMIHRGDCGSFNPRLLLCLDQVQIQLKHLCIEQELEDPAIPASPEGFRGKLFEDGLTDRTLILLEREREKYQSLANLSDEILFDYDADSDVLTFSEKFHDIFGKDCVIRDVKEQLTNGGFFYLEPEVRKRLLSLRHNFSPENRADSIELFLPHTDGSSEWYELVFKTLWSRDLLPVYTGCIGKLTNINERKLETTRLREEASRDPLTGLYNRSAGYRLIGERLTSPDIPGALLFLDIDNFKHANDRFGHAFGDKVLQLIADELRKSFRSTDILCRTGGDEFIVYMDKARHSEDIVRRVSDLMTLFAKDHEILQEDFFISASIGISLYPKDGLSCSELAEHADQALYRSKSSGKGTYTFY